MNTLPEFLRDILAYWTAGGPLLIPIGLASFAIGALVLYANRELTETLADGLTLEHTMAKGTSPITTDPLSACMASRPGKIAPLIAAAIDEIRQGVSPTQAFAGQIDPFAAHLKRNFILIAALTSLAPLLGLLGTVSGMIETFNAVAVISENLGGKVAGGISKALITTQFGLVVSIPGLFGLTRLHRRMILIEEILASCKAKTIVKLTRDTTCK